MERIRTREQAEAMVKRYEELQGEGVLHADAINRIADEYDAASDEVHQLVTRHERP